MYASAIQMDAKRNTYAIKLPRIHWPKLKAPLKMYTVMLLTKAPMTPIDLRAWQARMGYTYVTAAAALGISRATFAEMLAGISRTTKKPIAIDKRTALACFAIEAGLNPAIDKH